MPAVSATGFVNLRLGASRAILAFAGHCAHGGIDCCLLYIALLGLQCVTSFEQYFSDRFYGRVIFIPAFTQELFFANLPFWGVFSWFYELDFGLLYIFFFLLDIVLREFYCIYTDLYYYCVEWIERKGGGHCVSLPW